MIFVQDNKWKKFWNLFCLYNIRKIVASISTLSQNLLAVLYLMTADSITVRSEREYQGTMEHISIDIMSYVDKRRRYHSIYRLLYVKNSIIIHNYVFRFC